jgi:hypothetical protein
MTCHLVAMHEGADRRFHATEDQLMSRNAEVMSSHHDITELSLSVLAVAVGGETAPAGDAAPAQTPGTGVASPDFGWGYGRGWCYWHPYVCRK